MEYRLNKEIYEPQNYKVSLGYLGNSHWFYLLVWLKIFIGNLINLNYVELIIHWPYSSSASFKKMILVFRLRKGWVGNETGVGFNFL